MYDIIETNIEEEVQLMKRCSLCGRKISNEGYCFGLSCLKKSCAIVGIKNVKNLKAENRLNNKIQKLNRKILLNKEQKQLLTNRYLTNQVLCQIDLPYYQNLAKSINKQVKKINNKTTDKDIEKSKNYITLKNAFEILQLYNRYKNLLEKTQNYTTEKLINEIQNLPWDTLSFAFSFYYEKKPYLNDLMQVVQLFIWKIVVAISAPLYKCGSDFLNHSLQAEPEDMYITEGKIIEEIKEDANFIKKIDNIIKKYGNKNSFDTKDKENLNYKDFDLFFALNKTRYKCKR